MTAPVAHMLEEQVADEVLVEEALAAKEQAQEPEHLGSYATTPELVAA